MPPTSHPTADDLAATVCSPPATSTAASLPAPAAGQGVGTLLREELATFGMFVWPRGVWKRRARFVRGWVAVAGSSGRVERRA